jgi:hypothetical protein
MSKQRRDEMKLPFHLLTHLAELSCAYDEAVLYHHDQTKGRNGHQAEQLLEQVRRIRPSNHFALSTLL